MSEPLDLICVPHAGGSARTFLPWRRQLPPTVRVVPLEIAGRGRRARETRPDTLRAAAADLLDRFDPRRTYAILGHSMGGLIAYEMARVLAENEATAPAFVVVAGTRPPHLLLPREYRRLTSLPDDALIDALVAAGTVPEALRNSPMRDLFTPIIRGDLELIGGHRSDPEPDPPAIDLLVWSGVEDESTPHRVMAQWQRHTSRPCRFSMFAGDHFFVHQDLDRVADELHLAAPVVERRAA